jgi:tetratricopeptide (TPR) repeat protein
MRRMEEGFSSGARMIVLLSSRYQASEHCRAEYNQILARDPSNLEERLIVLRIEACEAKDNLAALAYTDLVPALGDPEMFRKVVRSALGIDTSRPAVDFWQAFRRHGRKIRHSDIRAVKGFAGRRDMLDALRQKLSGTRGTVAIRNSGETTLALRGLGGVGKTVLATQYAWDNQDEYCGLWWIRGQTRETTIEDLAALGARMGLATAGQEPEQAALMTLDGIAQTRTDKPWLLVYDNVDDQALIRRLTPANNAHVLITTRLTLWHGEADELAVDVFDQETAVSFLLEQVDDKAGSADAAARLAKALNRLPLALSHARSYCRARSWSFDQYIAHLPELIKRVPANAAYPASVFATFSLAIERAAAEQPAAERLMSLFAYVAADQIPLWLVPGEELEELERGDALAALAGLSLITLDRLESGASAVSLHRLVQEVMRARLAECGQAPPVIAFLARVVIHGYDDSNSFTGAVRNSEWHPQALAFLAHAQQSGAGAQHTIGTHIRVGDFGVSRGETAAPLVAYRAAQSLAERLARTEPDSDPDNVGWQRYLSASQEKVGSMLQTLGNLSEALTSFQTSMAIQKRLTDADPRDAGRQRDLSVALVKIGEVLRRQGDLSEALTNLRTAMAIDERLADASPESALLQRDLLVTHNMIGNVLRDQGNLSEALASYRACMAIAQRLVDTDPGNALWQRDLSGAHIKIGNMLRNQGNLREALKNYRASMAVAQRLVDADPGNADWQHNLSVSHDKIGDVFQVLGNLSEALANYRASMAIAQRLANVDPANSGWQRDLSMSHDQIGEMLVGLGNLSEALASFRASWAIRSRLADSDPNNADWQRDVWTAMLNLRVFPESGVTWADIVARMEATHANVTLAPPDMEFLETARANAAGEK